MDKGIISVKKEENGALLVTIEGELSRTYFPQNDVMNAIKAKKKGKVVLQMEKVTYMDSVGVGNIMQYYKEAVKNKLVFEINKPSTKVKQIFALFNIDQLFIFTD